MVLLLSALGSICIRGTRRMICKFTCYRSLIVPCFQLLVALFGLRILSFQPFFPVIHVINSFRFSGMRKPAHFWAGSSFCSKPMPLLQLTHSSREICIIFSSGIMPLYASHFHSEGRSFGLWQCLHRLHLKEPITLKRLLVLNIQ